MAGLVAAARTTPTKRGDTLCFVTLADEDGLFEVTLFPDVYRRYGRELSENELGPFIVEGSVESQYDAVTVTAERMESATSCLQRRKGASTVVGERRKCGRHVSVQPQ